MLSLICKIYLKFTVLLIAVYVLTSAAVFVIILNKQVKSAILQSRTCALSAAGTGSLSCGRNYRSLKPANAVYVSHPAVAYRSNWKPTAQTSVFCISYASAVSQKGNGLKNDRFIG